MISFIYFPILTHVPHTYRRYLTVILGRTEAEFVRSTVGIEDEFAGQWSSSWWARTAEDDQFLVRRVSLLIVDVETQKRSVRDTRYFRAYTSRVECDRANLCEYRILRKIFIISFEKE